MLSRKSEKVPTSATPGLDSLPLCSSNSYSFDPRIKFVACKGKDRYVHLGYIIRSPKKKLYAHCQRQGAGSFQYTEVPGVDVKGINCKRCRERLKLLRDPNSSLCKAVDNHRRYYYGRYAYGVQPFGRNELVHLYIIPIGSNVDSPDLQPFCRCLIQEPLSLRIIPDYDLKIITCKYCKQNFDKLPKRDADGKPHGKADMWYISGDEGYHDVKPTLVKNVDAGYGVTAASAPETVINLDSSDDDGEDDEEVPAITNYK